MTVHDWIKRTKWELSLGKTTTRPKQSSFLSDKPSTETNAWWIPVTPLVGLT